LNRPFDDQGQDRIRLESEAVLMILAKIEQGLHELVSSDALDLENSLNPDEERRRWISGAMDMAVMHVTAQEPERDRAKALHVLGLGAYDSLHIACAESSGADILLTTDDRLLKAAKRHAGKLLVDVLNPIQWVSGNEYANHD
jgi:predicted nucleic acid-binding protein